MSIFLGLQYSLAIHLRGTWHSQNLILFLTKFGFQKTNPQLLEDSQGFIYGNITTSSNVLNYFNLVLVDSEYFMELYGNGTRRSTAKSCPRMFNKIDSLAWDSKCRPEGTQDFLRKIPCPRNRLCIDEDDPSNVLPGFQFTYKVQNTQMPR